MKAWSACLWVGLGGFLGANARYFMARWVAAWLGIGFPFGTFLINISGSFLLGVAATLISQRLAPHGDHLRLTFAIGFIGAYTTFSTFEFETNALLEDGRWAYALLNVVGSLALGLLAVKLGILLTRRWV
jgi:CrcB protein